MVENRRFGCVAIILASIIIAAIFTALFSLFPPSVVLFSVIAILVVAIFALLATISLISLASSAQTHSLTKCTGQHASCLLIGLFGTIIASIIAIPVLILSLPISSIIALFVVIFFFSVLIISLILLLRCLIAKLYYRSCDR